jgi:squalene synthase HpnC
MTFASLTHISLTMPVEHYENFPVASILLPKKLRPAVEAIYAFARSADDLADEGEAAIPQRLAALNAYENALNQIEQGQTSSDPMFARLQQVIAQYQLPMQPFYDLLSAFKQDVVTTRYADFALLLDYCRRSANPVGCLMLNLYRATDTRNMRDSDAICSALQLINFWQDVAIDWQKQRIYLPLDTLAQFQVSEQHIEEQINDAAWQAMLGYEVQRARALMLSGSNLPLRLPGRIGWELRLVVQGGLRILERIERVNYDVFRHRPKLGWRDWLVIGWRALRMGRG